MVSTYTPNKRIEQPGFNDYIDTWDVPVNNDWSIIDLALGGSITLNATGLTGDINLSVSQYQPLKIIITGTPIGNVRYRVPLGVGGLWVVRNDTSGGFLVRFSTVGVGANVEIPAGQNTLATCDGSADGMFPAVNTAPAAAGSNTQIQFNSGGILSASSNLTWTGTALRTSSLNVTGSTILGDAVGDTITVNAGTAAIPNGLNIGSNNLYLSGTKVGIGTATLGSELLTVAGVIYSTAGGIKFPNGTTQTTAAAAVAGANTNVQFNDGGALGGQANFSFVKGTGVLSVPSLVLTTPLALTSGGTGGTTATGTGAVVLATSPTLTTPTLTSATLTTPTINGGTLSTTVTGVTQAASDDSTKLATTAYVKDQFGGGRIGAFAVFDGATVAIASSANITSITHLGTGQYRVVMTTAMPNANYAVSGTTNSSVGATTSLVLQTVPAPTTTTFEFATTAAGAGGADFDRVSVVVTSL